MNLLLYSVFDHKVQAYMQPFFAQSKGSAMRSFIDCVNDDKHPLGKAYADYVLFELGGWCDSTAAFDTYLSPKPVITGVEARVSVPAISHEDDKS